MMEKLNLKITDDAKHISKTPELSNRFSAEHKVKLAKASKDFESLMTSYLVKNLTSSTEGLFGDEGFGGGSMNSIFESELGNYISKSHSLGIAEMIYKKLTGEDINSIQNPPKANDKIDIKENESRIENELEKELKDDVPAEPVEIKTDKNIHEVIPSEKSINRLNKYDDIIEKASAEFGIDKNIIKSVILAESAGNERAVSVSKAKGLMQLLDSTAKDMGVKNIWNPKENVRGGARYLSQLINQYDGNLKMALAAYNAGPGNVERYNGVPPFSETKNYIARVMGYLNYFNG